MTTEERQRLDADARPGSTCSTRIRARRRVLGLTQVEVSARLAAHGTHLSNQVLSGIENGRGIAAGHLPGLAAALDCTVTYLLGLTADPHRWTPDTPTPAPRDPATAPTKRTERIQRTEQVRRAERTSLPAASADRPRHNWILSPDPPP